MVKVVRYWRGRQRCGGGGRRKVSDTRPHRRHSLPSTTQICLTKPAYNVNLPITRLGIDDALQVFPQYKVPLIQYNNKTIIG